ncbi:MAG: NAD-dependent epimerase/dehydratase family protein [Myxococcales bacterium]|nr:NAD-dependent epimerase/dehydratase family protein [Myxococcales bacterium]
MSDKSASSRRRVCLTGATGLIGGQIAAKLVERNFTVHCIVRSLGGRVAHLRLLAPHARLFEASDLLERSSYSDALHGCDALLHIANPMFAGATVETSVNLTATALEAANDAGIRRVILMASMASICGTQKRVDPTHLWCEDDWNDEMGSVYSESKTKAEKRAWEIAERNEMRLTTLHPAMAMGPLVPSQAPTSTVAMLLGQLRAAAQERGAYGVVDVRDIAETAALCLQRGESAGHRYLLASRDQYSVSEVIEFARQACEAMNAGVNVNPSYSDGSRSVGAKPASDPSKVERLLGRPLISAQESVRSTVAHFVHAGLL